MRKEQFIALSSDSHITLIHYERYSSSFRPVHPFLSFPSFHFSLLSVQFPQQTSGLGLCGTSCNYIHPSDITPLQSALSVLLSCAPRTGCLAQDDRQLWNREQVSVINVPFLWPRNTLIPAATKAYNCGFIIIAHSPHPLGFNSFISVRKPFPFQGYAFIYSTSPYC